MEAARRLSKSDLSYKFSKIRSWHGIRSRRLCEVTPLLEKDAPDPYYSPGNFYVPYYEMQYQFQNLELLIQIVEHRAPQSRVLGKYFQQFCLFRNWPLACGWACRS
jgi:hypothetical protein